MTLIPIPNFACFFTLMLLLVSYLSIALILPQIKKWSSWFECQALLLLQDSGRLPQRPIPRWRRECHTQLRRRFFRLGAVQRKTLALVQYYGTLQFLRCDLRHKGLQRPRNQQQSLGFQRPPDSRRHRGYALREQRLYSFALLRAVLQRTLE